MSIYVGQNDLRELYVGTSSYREVYLGNNKIWPVSLWPFVDTFSRSQLGANWEGNNLEIVNNDYLRATNSPPWGSGPFRYTAKLTAIQPPTALLWRASMVIANVPDAVQRTRLSVGRDEGNRVWVDVNKTETRIGWTVNGTDTISKTVTGALGGCAPGDTIFLSKMTSLNTAVVVYKNNDSVASMNWPSGVIGGVGNQHLMLTPAVYRGGITLYHSPGVTSVRFANG